MRVSLTLIAIMLFQALGTYATADIVGVWSGFENSSQLRVLDPISGTLTSTQALTGGARAHAMTTVGDEVWIGFEGASLVFRYDKDANFLGSFSNGTSVSDIENVGNEVWTSSRNQNLIRRYSNTGTLLGMIGTGNPISDLEVVNNEVWTGLETVPQIRRYSTSGTFLAAFSTPRPIHDLEFVPQLNQVWTGFETVAAIDRWSVSGSYMGAFSSSLPVTELEVIGDQVFHAFRNSSTIIRWNALSGAFGGTSGSQFGTSAFANVTASNIPEPASGAVLSVLVAGIAVRRKKTV